MVETLSNGIIGKLFGDKGYISAEIAKNLFQKGLRLFTSLRDKMKQKLISLEEKILLRKKSIIRPLSKFLSGIWPKLRR